MNRILDKDIKLVLKLFPQIRNRFQRVILIRPSRGSQPPREKQDCANQHFESVRAAYSRITENNWNRTDSVIYEENMIGKVPTEKVISAMETVARRTPSKINSFRYFIKEILAVPDARNRAWQKKQLERIVRRIRDIAAGRANYSSID